MSLRQPAKPPVDFAIITALPIERDAVLSRLDQGYELIQEDNEPLTYYSGYITIPASGECYKVVVVMLLGPGNDEAAVGTTRTIHRWRPEHVLMVGIAGGIVGKVALGDVVVADSVHYYEMAKLTPEGDQARPEQFISSRLLYGRAKAYEASEWKGEIGVDRPNDSRPQALPEALFGVIAAGEKVIAHSEAVRKLLSENTRIKAVAMEGAGVARSTVNEIPSPDFLEIRGICDFADENKNDDWQVYAANAAAAFTVGLLRSRPVSPLAAKPQEGKTAPLLSMRAESLRTIAPNELLEALSVDLAGRDIETVALDFTDLVQGDLLTTPAQAVQRIINPQGVLFGALARRGDAELIFHGLVHIPLAFLIGHVITDRQRVRMFDFHPNVDSGTWAWPGNDEEVFSQLEIHGVPKRKINRAGEAVVRVSASYEVTAAQTRVNVREALAEVQLTAPRPERGLVRSEEQTRSYGRQFRFALDEIARQIPACNRVHVFYAGPVSLAFHLGQQISANIHPPVTVWNFRRGHYEWGIDLSAASIGEDCVVYPATQEETKE